MRKLLIFLSVLLSAVGFVTHVQAQDDVISVDGIQSGEQYLLAPIGHEGYYVTINASGNIRQGLVTDTGLNANKYYWIVTRQDDGTYTLKNVDNNKYMTAGTGTSTDPVGLAIVNTDGGVYIKDSADGTNFLNAPNNVNANFDGSNNSKIFHLVPLDNILANYVKSTELALFNKLPTLFSAERISETTKKIASIPSEQGIEAIRLLSTNYATELESKIIDLQTSVNGQYVEIYGGQDGNSPYYYFSPGTSSSDAGYVRSYNGTDNGIKAKMV